MGVGFDMKDFDIFLFHALVLFWGVSGGHSLGLLGVSTVNLCNVHAKLVAFFEDPLAPGFYEVVELDGELGHAVAQLVEAEVDRGERVCH